MKNIHELNEEELKIINGGSAPDEGVSDDYIDDIINGDNYDSLADWIYNKLDHSKRTRKVNNDCDIYDCGV